MRSSHSAVNLDFTFDLFVCAAILTLNSEVITQGTDAASVYGCMNGYDCYVVLFLDFPSSFSLCPSFSSPLVPLPPSFLLLPSPSLPPSFPLPPFPLPPSFPLTPSTMPSNCLRTVLFLSKYTHLKLSHICPFFCLLNILQLKFLRP